MKNIIEFKVGDFITYKPYEKSLKAKVIKVNVSTHLFNKSDNRVFYDIEGKNVFAITTGLSIKESIYFERSQVN